MMQGRDLTQLSVAERIDCIERSCNFLDDSELGLASLHSASNRLFDDENVEILVWLEAEANAFSRISDNSALQEYLDTWSRFRNSAFIIKQQYTFGPLLISLENYQRPANLYRPFEPFNNIIRSFGRDASDEDYSGYFLRTTSTVSEVCYNIRYPALHGRPSGPPWSIRHMALYQKYSKETRRSNWILLGPSQAIEQRLEKIFLDELMLDANPVLPILTVLQSSETGWEAYLKSLRKQYEKIQNMARYSKVGTVGHDSFGICFKDTQKLELISQKLSICSTILASSLDIAAGCVDFVNEDEDACKGCRPSARAIRQDNEDAISNPRFQK
ncbi:hypothetical protein BDZ45DRAFT_805004 [Acephala macrosclerotiorum]|nr:hypothetical protein BDZ45DRAFT_805004 [Acephala macrosclerotiorum]